MRYQDAASDAREGTDPRHEEHIQDLTLELFSAVIRLAFALGDRRPDLEKLAQPVRLLATVRLERIKRLDVLCEREVGVKGTCACACGHACAGTNKPESMVQGISATVARQVEQAIGDKFSAAQTGINGEVERLVSGVIKEEFPRLPELVQKNLEKKMREEVQGQLAEARASEPRRGLLWG